MIIKKYIQAESNAFGTIECMYYMLHSSALAIKEQINTNIMEEIIRVYGWQVG
jgi:hypothetical protein